MAWQKATGYNQRSRGETLSKLHRTQSENAAELAGRAFLTAPLIRFFGLGQQAFGAYLAYGVGLLITLQATINIGVNMGALPTKGLTLPFISYGGNSILSMSFAVGLVLRVYREYQMADGESALIAKRRAKTAKKKAVKA